MSYQKILLSETTDDLRKDRYKAYHTSTSLSFINKFFLMIKKQISDQTKNKVNQARSEFMFSTIISNLWHLSSDLNLLSDSLTKCSNTLK